MDDKQLEEVAKMSQGKCKNCSLKGTDNCPLENGGGRSSCKYCNDN